MPRINPAPVSGMRDYLPPEIAKRQWVFRTIEGVFRSHGFQPLETPVMERLDVLRGHYGDDEKLIFKVLKRGDKLKGALAQEAAEEDIADSGLRYDLTVPLARVVAAYHNELPRIFRRYHIAPVFRAERPAAGRFREFYQCDIDIVGSTALLCEVELLSAALLALQKLGLNDPGQVRVKLNHRALLTALMTGAGLPEALHMPAMISLDKLDKIGRGGVDEELKQKGVAESARQQLWALLPEVAGLPQERKASSGQVALELAALRSKIPDNDHKLKAFEELERLWSLLAPQPIAEQVDFDPTLARGLGYYTGCIFEISIGGFGLSCGGGGRYDHLIGQFLGESVPACGISLGVERLLLILEEKGLFPATLTAASQALIANFDAAGEPAMLRLAAALRQAGITCEVYPEQQKLAKQFKYAERQAIPLVILAGPDERLKGEWTMKIMGSGQQTTMPESALVAGIKAHVAVH